MCDKVIRTLYTVPQMGVAYAQNKKIVILQHNKGQLCNQLWNFVSIYSYCLERGYRCQNYSFFEYSKYFNIPVENKLINFLFFKIYSLYSRFLPLRIARKIGQIYYSLYVALIRYFRKKQVVYSGNSFEEIKDFYLPPTKRTEGKLAKLEEDKNVDTIYFDGWLFRNPVGLSRYRRRIIDYFQPKKIYREKVNKLIKNLREKHNHLVGVHIRQNIPGDGKEVILDGTKMYISVQELGLVEKSFKIYLERFKKDSSQTCFLICSNKNIDISYFPKELNVVFAEGNLVEDLYTLSKTDAIIGCRSTFSSFAAFYGNVPHFMILESGEIKEATSIYERNKSKF